MVYQPAPIKYFAEFYKVDDYETISFYPVIAWVEDDDVFVGCVPNTTTNLGAIEPITNKTIVDAYGDFIRYTTYDEIEKRSKELDEWRKTPSLLVRKLFIYL